MTDSVGTDAQAEQAPAERRALDEIEVRLGRQLATLYRLERTLNVRFDSSSASGLTPEHRARAIRSGLVLGKRLAEQREVVEALAREERAAREKYVDAVGDAISRAKRAKGAK